MAGFTGADELLRDDGDEGVRKAVFEGFGSGRWFSPRPGVKRTHDVPEAMQIGLADELTVALRGLHHAEVAGEAVSLGELWGALRGAVPMMHEVLRLAASRDAGDGPFLGSKNRSFEERAALFGDTMLNVSGYFGMAVDDDEGDEPTFGIAAFGQVMAQMPVVHWKQTNKVTGEQISGSADLENHDDLMQLVANTDFNPIVAANDVFAKLAGVDEGKLHVMGSFLPVAVPPDEWEQTGFSGEHSTTVMALSLSHRSGGHLTAFLESRINAEDEVELRLVNSLYESVTEHRDRPNSHFRTDPFGSREDNQMQFLESDPEQAFAELRKMRGARGEENSAKQLARMMRGLADMLDKTAEDREGWQEFDEQGELKDVKQDDPFEGLILSGAGRRAKA